ncbi:TetR family transcriptional regulator [Streptomyces viridosporus]|uniref:TetR family transcriptional regulator n=1 Tax=Streptomyces viridosporus TaxID=67581 RepID=UPI0033205D7E
MTRPRPARRRDPNAVHGGCFIVSAALRVFGRYGYRRSPMELMAQAARMPRPAVYQSIDAAR